MSLLGSIYTSMSGLSVSSKGLSNLSNNIANINTPGFKGTDLFYRSTGEQGAEIGGSSIRFANGDITATGNNTDMAVEGSGLFILRDGDKQYYTRAGQFQFDQNGFLFEPTSGYRVATLSESGNIVDFNINNFKTVEFNKSTLLKLEGTLNKSVLIGGKIPAANADPIEVQIIDENGASHKINLSFTKLTDSSWSVDYLSKNGSKLQASHTIEFNPLGSLISDTASGDLAFEDFMYLSAEDFAKSFSAIPKTSITQPFTIDPSGTGKLITSANGNLTFIDGGHFSLNNDGLLINAESGGVLAGRDIKGNLIEFDLSDVKHMPGKATTVVTLNGSLNKTFSTTSSAPPAIVNKIIYPPLTESGIAFQVHNALGETVNLKARFTKETTNGDLWSLTVTDETDLANIKTATVNRNLGFDSLGNLLNGTVNITIAQPDNKTLSFALDFSGGPDQPGLVLSSGTTASAIKILKDDGFKAGELSHISFDKEGQSVLYFTNEQTLNSHKLAIAEPENRKVSGVKMDFSQLSSIANAPEKPIKVTDNDGKLSGQMTTMSFLKDGAVEVQYSNGDKTKIGNIALAKFDNPELLQALNGALFENTKNLTFSIGKPGDVSLGKLIASSLEMSNVDLSQEFSEIIIIQRGYQASSQVLNVANDMIQTLYSAVSGR